MRAHERQRAECVKGAAHRFDLCTVEYPVGAPWAGEGGA